MRRRSPADRGARRARDRRHGPRWRRRRADRRGGGPAFPPGFADTLRAYSTILFKGDTARAIRTHDAAFWQDKNDLTDAEIDVVRRVFAQHESRTAGALDPRHCIAAVDQIIREVA